MKTHITSQILEKQCIFSDQECCSFSKSCTTVALVFFFSFPCTIWVTFPTDAIVMYRALEMNCALLKTSQLSTLLTVLAFTCVRGSLLQ